MHSIGLPSAQSGKIEGSHHRPPMHLSPYHIMAILNYYVARYPHLQTGWLDSYLKHPAKFKKKGKKDILFMWFACSCMSRYILRSCWSARSVWQLRETKLPKSVRVRTAFRYACAVPYASSYSELPTFKHSPERAPQSNGNWLALVVYMFPFIYQIRLLRKVLIYTMYVSSKGIAIFGHWGGCCSSSRAYLR